MTTSRGPAEQYEPLRKNQGKKIKRLPLLIINYEQENRVIQRHLAITLAETRQTRKEVNISRLVRVKVKDRKKMKTFFTFREKEATLKKRKRVQWRDREYKEHNKTCRSLTGEDEISRTARSNDFDKLGRRHRESAEGDKDFISGNRHCLKEDKSHTNSDSSDSDGE